MDKFIQGAIESMDGEYGVYYELRLRLLEGNIIPLFYDNLLIVGPSNNNDHLKATDPISATLAVGQSYELLVTIRVQNFTYAPTTPEGVVFKVITKEFPRRGKREPVRRNNIRQGRILDASWSPSGLSYQAIATPNIFEQHYVLLETAIGLAVINRQIIDEQVREVAIGGYLEWSSARLDILAILQDEQPDEIQVFPL
jgi:hypothetical protein